MEKIKIQKKDEFVIDGNNIICFSRTGNRYIIVKNHCECKSFSFHHTCRHYEQAEKMGLIDELETRAKLDPKDPSTFYNSLVVRKERILAIKAYLVKQEIAFDDTLINTIEAKLTPSTKPEELLALARS